MSTPRDAGAVAGPIPDDAADTEATASLPERLNAPGHGPVLVLGGPGTGKTALARSLVIDRLRGGMPAESILVLAPSRTQAERLRDELALSSGITFSEPLVRTFSGYAFDLIARARAEGLVRGDARPPRLMTGAEQDAFLAELLSDQRERGDGPAWPESLGQAMGTRGFRKELREFLDRVAEAGLEADDVEALGRRCGVPEWVAGAQMLREYREVGLLSHVEAIDPAELVTLVLSVFRRHEDFAARERARLRLLVVDDLQEATRSQQELVRVLAQGTDAALLASPDTVVQGFRGARPDLVRHLAGRLGAQERPGQSDGAGAGVIELEHNHRLGDHLGAAVRRVSLRIPSASGEAGRRWSARGGTPDLPADVRVVESPVHRDRLISRHVLEAHLTRGVDYEDIAVIVRNGAQVRAISRALGLDGISTEVPPVELPLREEVAVRPLLELLERALAPARPCLRDHREAAADAAAVEALLMGPYGRGSSLDVRWLRQRLLIRDRAARLSEVHTGDERPERDRPEREHHGRAQHGAPSSTHLLAALLDGGITGTELRELGTTAMPAQRIVDMLAAARRHLEGEHTPATALWSLWASVGLAGEWRTQALGERGLRSDRAHRDLDAVMALFQAAERFVDQHPGAGVASFLEHVRGQDLPMDSLARTGSTSGRVKVLTPAAAAGREWDTVIVAGLEEGLWPSTGLRGQLLRSDDLATVAEHGPEALRDASVAEKLRSVRDDELRQFVTAISRARVSLHLIGISGDEATPSSFLELVRSDHSEPLEVSAVPRARTLPSLTALLRRTLEERADARSADAAGVLARLASQERAVAGADPESWWGLAPLSSKDPIVGPGETVRVSPSKVETVLSSPLNWFVQVAGGTAPVDFARSLGTLIHAIAERYPEAGEEQLIVALHHDWDRLQMPENWVGSVELERAERMLGRLAGYYRAMHDSGRELVAREQRIGVDLPPRSEGEHPVRITGSIDRVEADADGHPYVVDLKTGKLVPTAMETERHPQLATYQVAIVAGALGPGPDDAAGSGADVDPARRPAGAALVALGKETAKATIRAQAPWDPEDPWASDMVADAAELMSRAEFVAMHEQGGQVRCTLPGTCPLCAEGRQVTEP